MADGERLASGVDSTSVTSMEKGILWKKITERLRETCESDDEEGDTLEPAAVRKKWTNLKIKDKKIQAMIYAHPVNSISTDTDIELQLQKSRLLKIEPDEDINKHKIEEKNCIKIITSKCVDLSNLLESGKHLADLILVSRNGKRIQAHRTILSACSPYLNSLLLEHRPSKPVILFPDIEHDVLQLVLQFIYTGKVEVTSVNVDSVLGSLKDLKVKGQNVSTSTPLSVFADDQKKKTLLDNEDVEVKDKFCPDDLLNDIDIDSDKDFENTTRLRRQDVRMLDMSKNTVSQDERPEISSDHNPSCIRFKWTEERELLLKNILEENGGELLSRIRDSGERIDTWKLIQKKFSDQCLLSENESGVKRIQIKQNLRYYLKSKGIRFAKNNRKIQVACPECGKIMNQCSLKSHEEKVHQQLKNFLCSFCDFKSARLAAMQDHIEAKHEKVLKYCCDVCGQKTSSKPSLWQHKKMAHGPKFSCPKCGKVMPLPSKVKHMRSHLSANERAWKYCDKCDHKTLSNTSLKEHFRGAHEGLKDNCHICGAEFSLGGGLRRHIRTVHEGKRFVCKICNHVTTQLTHLRAHMRKHRDVLGEDTDSVARATPATTLMDIKHSN